VDKENSAPVFVEGKEFLLTLSYPSVMNSFTASGFICTFAFLARRAQKIRLSMIKHVPPVRLQQGPAVGFTAAGKV
jgi:hypothetical protein